MFAPKNILVPTDFSKFSDAALKEAVDIASQHGSTIYLLHVISQEVQQCAIDYCLEYAVVEMLKKKSVETSELNLKKERDKIIKSKDIKVVFDVKKGVPAEVIIKEQKAKKIDLIVISSHGKTGLLKQLMGSVAEKVIKGATCPVIVVKK
jgi:universal stress protein A